MTKEIRFIDRYSATGTPRPEPETVCTGQCEGMGCFPTRDVSSAGLARDRGALPPDAKSDDGYYFVNCTACGGDENTRGSGRRDGRPMRQP